MQLEDFFDYKNQLMKDVLTNKEIVRLLNDDIALEDAANLAYEQVMPFEYIGETLFDGRTFIMFDVDIQAQIAGSNKTFYSPTIYVWVMAHRSRMRLPDGGGVRTDKLCSEICKTINGSRLYGLGQLNLYSVRRFAPVTDYTGKMMTFHAKEFNRQYDPTQYVPSNRKSG